MKVKTEKRIEKPRSVMTIMKQMSALIESSAKDIVRDMHGEKHNLRMIRMRSNTIAGLAKRMRMELDKMEVIEE